MSNPEIGLCCYCGERNFYTQTHCKRCESVLPWGVLLKPELYKPRPAPTINWLVRFLNTVFDPTGQGAKCRYCLQPIVAEALVCRHCHRLLCLGVRATPQFTSYGDEGHATDYINQNSPELKVLIENYLKGHPEGL